MNMPAVAAHYCRLRCLLRAPPQRDMSMPRTRQRVVNDIERLMFVRAYRQRATLIEHKRAAI